MGRRRTAGMVVALGLVLASGAALGSSGDRGVDDVVQTLADLTLIDGSCQGLSVNFGIGFAFARDHGVSPAAILPTGPLRKAFEAALQSSTAGYPPETACGALAVHYSIAVPGSVTFPASSRRDGS